jgi:5-methylcytosine-specific restriction enzyme B
MTAPHPHQQILFGPPGTSKSHRAKHEKAKQLQAGEQDIFPVAFHPEFNHGEFVSRLLPLTKNRQIEYGVHAGPFLRALARAYARLPADGQPPAPQPGNVVLLIDEINRGNCAEIFGDVFHLLDREDDGWSSYEIGVSDLTIEALLAELQRHQTEGEALSSRVEHLIVEKKLSLPPNLYMIGTMNTSDDSIFYMDSAFKRRWNFEFVPPNFVGVPQQQRTAQICGRPDLTWEQFVDALNNFILKNCGAPKLDDKLVGPWFIKARHVAEGKPSTIGALHAEELHDLSEMAGTVGEYMRGADNSDKFDALFRKFADNLSPTTRASVLDFAGFKDEGKRRKLTVIDFDNSSEYYYSRKRGLVPSDGKVVIEDFLDGLAKLPAPAPTSEISRNDIVGKLFLYLWDNVFDRDKSPLVRLLEVSRDDLRTFGQFADRADRFIERLTATAAQTKVA